MRRDFEDYHRDFFELYGVIAGRVDESGRVTLVDEQFEEVEIESLDVLDYLIYEFLNDVEIEQPTQN